MAEIITKEQRGLIRFVADTSDAQSLHNQLLEALDTCDALERERDELKEAFRILAKWGTIAPAVTSDTERQRLRDAVIEAARIRHSSPLAGAYVCPVCDAIAALDALEKEHS